MARTFHDRRASLSAVLLMALAPIWCCCAAVMADVPLAPADEPGTEPRSACGSCLGQQPGQQQGQSGDPAGPADDPADCGCSSDLLLVTGSWSSSAAKVAAGTPGPLPAISEAIPSDLPDRIAPRLSAASTAPLPGAVSLLSLRCLLTT